MEERPLEEGAERARWILAYLLDFHRRSEKQEWARYFELCDKTDEELLDETEAVAGLTCVERVEIKLHKTTKKPTGSVVDRYAFPSQEMEIRRVAELKTRDAKFGDVVAIDRFARTIEVSKGPKAADAHPAAARRLVATSAMSGVLVVLPDNSGAPVAVSYSVPAVTSPTRRRKES